MPTTLAQYYQEKRTGTRPRSRDERYPRDEFIQVQDKPAASGSGRRVGVSCKTCKAFLGNSRKGAQDHRSRTGHDHFVDHRGKTVFPDLDRAGGSRRRDPVGHLSHQQGLSSPPHGNRHQPSTKIRSFPTPQERQRVHEAEIAEVMDIADPQARTLLLRRVRAAHAAEGAAFYNQLQDRHLQDEELRGGQSDFQIAVARHRGPTTPAQYHREKNRRR